MQHFVGQINDNKYTKNGHLWYPASTDVSTITNKNIKLPTLSTFTPTPTSTFTFTPTPTFTFTPTPPTTSTFTPTSTLTPPTTFTPTSTFTPPTTFTHTTFTHPTFTHPTTQQQKNTKYAAVFVPSLPNEFTSSTYIPFNKFKIKQSTPIKSEPDQLKLFPCQVDNHYRTEKMLQNQIGYINCSPTGAGKTESTLALAATLGLHIFVVGPPAVLDNWNEKTTKYGFTNYVGISYHSLRGNSVDLNHPWLTRYEDMYYPTEYLRSYIRAGTLFVFDEIQFAKNAKSITNKACHAIVREIVKLNTKSRVALLSATPYDKPIFSESIVKMLGIVSRTKMYEYDQKSREYILESYGMIEMIDWCRRMDPEKTALIMYKFPTINRKSIGPLCQELFTTVLRDNYVSVIIPDYPTKLFAKNGYYKMSPTATKRINELSNDMSAAAGYNASTETIQSKVNFGAINKILHDIEWVKLEILMRIVPEILNSNLNAQVIIYLWYKDTTKYLAEYLRNYNPGIINGSVPLIKRSGIVKAFQEDNSQSRLLIGHPIAGGVGLSLDDTHGNRPRYIFIIPTYHLIDSTQAMGRIQRMSSASDGTVFFVYSKEQTQETKILDALSRKENTVREVIGGESTIVMPGKLEKYVEN